MGEKSKFTLSTKVNSKYVNVLNAKIKTIKYPRRKYMGEFYFVVGRRMAF